MLTPDWPQVDSVRVMRMNLPEWPYILLGLLGSIVMGGAMPVYAILFGEVIHPHIYTSTYLHIYRVSGLSCPDAQAYLTVIFHSFLHNNNINSDYILGANIYFTPHSIFSSYF